jgi:CheY-like chemotaxis protein
MQTGQIQVLVVDDDQELCELISESFSLLGCQVTKAATGRQALACLSKNSFKIVITDIRMPDGDGMSLLDSIRLKHNTEPHVFMVSGYTDFSVEQVLDHGADGLFAKPFGAAVLRETVVKAIMPVADRLQMVPSESPRSCWKLETGAKNLTQNFKLGNRGFSWSLPSFTSLPDEMVAFSVVVDQKVYLEGVGRVRWARQADNGSWRSGIEFMYLEDRCRNSILAEIAKLNTKASIPAFP